MTQHYDVEWVKKKFDAGETLKFIFFWGHAKKPNEAIGNCCFSQWFEAPFTVDGILYRTAEHWMMAQKALLFNDRMSFDKIVNSKKPKEAKELGRLVKNFNTQVWNERRHEIVKMGNIHKFNQHQECYKYLEGTGNRILVEASPVDTIWGVGLSKESDQISNPHKWRGLNLLGFVLMEIREILQVSSGKEIT
jgi:ribA/ribD-fused uncharacterized protein